MKRRLQIFNRDSVILTEISGQYKVCLTWKHYQDFFYPDADRGLASSDNDVAPLAKWKWPWRGLSSSKSKVKVNFFYQICHRIYDTMKLQSSRTHGAKRQELTDETLTLLPGNLFLFKSDCPSANLLSSFLCSHFASKFPYFYLYLWLKCSPPGIIDLYFIYWFGSVLFQCSLAALYAAEPDTQAVHTK